MYELPDEYATPSWPSRVGAVAGVLLGLVLLVAVWGKALDPVAFAEQIAAEGLDFLVPAGSMTLLALAIEVALGLALVLGIRRLSNLVPTVAVVLLFLFLTGRAYWRVSQGLLDPADSCSCFGNLVDRSPAEAFWQDLLLLAPLTALSFVGYQRDRTNWPVKRLLAVVAATLAVVGFAWKAPDLPLDNLATRLKPGVIISTVCAGSEDDTRICLDGLIPELEEGEHLVIMAHLDDPMLLDSVDRLSDHAAAGDDPKIVLLSSATSEEVRAFVWQWAPSFEIREVPEGLIRPLYRRLPRSFAVRDGAVTETFKELPPL